MGLASITAPHLRAARLLIPVLTLVLVAGCRSDTRASTNSTQLPTAQATSSTTHDHDTIPSIERIRLEDARALFETGSAIFVDVRAPDAHEAGRIPGALSIPLETMTRPIGGLGSDPLIITYCT